MVITTFFDRGQPQRVSDDVVRYLNRSGIRRVIVGHKPFGDSPTFITQPGLQV